MEFFCPEAKKSKLAMTLIFSEDEMDGKKKRMEQQLDNGKSSQSGAGKPKGVHRKADLLPKTHGQSRKNRSAPVPKFLRPGALAQLRDATRNTRPTQVPSAGSKRLYADLQLANYGSTVESSRARGDLQTMFSTRHPVSTPINGQRKKHFAPRTSSVHLSRDPALQLAIEHARSVPGPQSPSSSGTEDSYVSPGGRETSFVPSGATLLTTPQSSIPAKIIGEPLTSPQSGGGGPAIDDVLPLEILIQVVCHLRHDQLRSVFSVSKRFQEAVQFARVIHFDFMTPAHGKRDGSRLDQNIGAHRLALPSVEGAAKATEAGNFASIRRLTIPPAPRQPPRPPEARPPYADVCHIAAPLFPSSSQRCSYPPLGFSRAPGAATSHRALFSGCREELCEVEEKPAE